MRLDSIITYVLLCGYSPFRSDDVKELIRETTEAKVEFHERYWKNISQEGNCRPALPAQQHPDFIFSEELHPGPGNCGS